MMPMKVEGIEAALRIDVVAVESLVLLINLAPVLCEYALRCKGS